MPENGIQLCDKQMRVQVAAFLKNKTSIHKILFSQKVQLYRLVLFCNCIKLLCYHFYFLLLQYTIEHWDTYWSFPVIVHVGSVPQECQAHALCEHTVYIHLYAHLIPTSQCLGSMTDTSCNFPHKPTVCNTATGFIFITVTSLKHFKFGRAAATTSPAPIKLKKSII